MSFPLSDNSVIVNIIPDENTKLLEPVNAIVSCCEYELNCKCCNIPVYCLNLVIFTSVIIIMIIAKNS